MNNLSCMIVAELPWNSSDNGPYWQVRGAKILSGGLYNNGKVEKRSAKSQGQRLYGLVPETSRNEQLCRGRASRITQLGIPRPTAQRSYIQGSRRSDWDCHVIILLLPLHIASTIAKEERYCYYLLRMSGAWRRKQTDATVAELTSL